MQEVVLVLCTGLIAICLCVTIIYWVTSSAIESSKLAREVQELKQLMQQLLNEQKNPAYVSEPFREYCQACASKLSPEDFECPVCAQHIANHTIETKE